MKGSYKLEFICCLERIQKYFFLSQSTYVCYTWIYFI